MPAALRIPVMPSFMWTSPRAMSKAPIAHLLRELVDAQRLAGEDRHVQLVASGA